MKEVGCELQEYCNSDCQGCKIAEITKQEQGIHNIKNAVYEAVQPLVDMIWEMSKTITNFLISQSPSNRVQYLAIYHKKKRVRKKNLHRIIKAINKELYK